MNKNIKIYTDMLALEMGAIPIHRSGIKVVFTTGVYDILHEGHEKYLQKAKNMGDILLVGLHGDSLVKKRKGEDRPYNPEMKRAEELLKNFPFIDGVMILKDQDAVYKTIDWIWPNILVMSETTEDKENSPAVMAIMIEKFELMEVVILPAQSDKHSSDFFKKQKVG